MTSLDDVFEQMRLFDQALRAFNEEVRTTAGSLARTHDEVRGLWQDEAGTQYQQAYEPLAELLDSYLKVEAPRLEGFLEKKVQQLERYLHGS
jgi:uncharacterized protein YukE